MIETINISFPRIALAGGELGRPIADLLASESVEVVYQTPRSLTPQLITPNAVIGGLIRRPADALRGLSNSGSLIMAITNIDAAAESGLTEGLISYPLTNAPNARLALAPKNSVDFCITSGEQDDETTRALWQLLAGTFVPTSYPNILIKALSDRGLERELLMVDEENISRPAKGITIVPVNGKVEGFSAQFPDDWVKAVVDVIKTGETLRDNDFDPSRAYTLMESTLALYLNPQKLANLPTEEQDSILYFLDLLGLPTSEVGKRNG